MFDTVVVGAGFAGSVIAERLANELGERILLIDRRDHIFHTNSADVFAYLSRFTEWRQYEHRVLASVDGRLVPIPINLDTVNALYGLQLDSAGMEAFLAARSEPVEHVRTSEDVVVSRVGRELYHKFFRNYTRKQWGLDPSELDASVTARVPVRTNRDPRYFGDRYQAMPKHGYTRLFERMLAHPNIKVMLKTNFAEIDGEVEYRRLVYTGPIDEFFEHRYGALPYRSLEFRHEIVDAEVAQPAPVVNYPNEHAYTRVTEFKYLTGQRHHKTAIVYEIPKADGDPYYPIPRAENDALYKRYKTLAAELPNVHFVGRLATYKYYNMDQVVAQALAVFAEIAGLRVPSKAVKTNGHDLVAPAGALGGARIDLQPGARPLPRPA
jgi:UDP-galactopyranose mutase